MLIINNIKQNYSIALKPKHLNKGQLLTDLHNLLLISFISQIFWLKDYRIN